MRAATPLAPARDAVEDAVGDLLDALGVDRSSKGLADTPARVARMYREFLSPEPFRATMFPNDGGYDGLVVVGDISFSSLCEHHLLPFSGSAHLAYVPGERLIGLSKLPRIVEHLSRRLQVQERLTAQIADRIERELAPRGVGVVLRATHMCMGMRGVRRPGATTTTSDLRGLLRTDPEVRGEFLMQAGGGDGPRHRPD